MDLLAGARSTVRSLTRSKGFALASTVTLALGIAATTTAFSVVYGVLLRPLPYPDASSLVVIQGEKDFSSGPRIMNFSPAELEEFVEASRAFSSVALVGASGMSHRTQEGIESISVATVSGAFFDTLGTPPLVGRVIGDEAEPNVVISHRLWRRMFGDGDLSGGTVRLVSRDNIERAYTVVGVMPPEFQYPRVQTDVWRPLAFVRSVGEGQVLNRNAGGYAFVARLRDGVTMDVARGDAERAVSVALSPHFGISRRDLRPTLRPLADQVRGDVGPALWLLSGAVGLMLLVACANAANLVLARQLSRAREVSVRMALGASRGRLIASLLAESAVVALAAGAMGVALATGAVGLLRRLQPPQLPRLDAIDVDAPVFAFAAFMAAVSALLAGLAPALFATKTDALAALKASPRTGTGGTPGRVRAGLVVVQIAASVVLVVGTALLARTLAELLKTDVGVRTEGIVAAVIDTSLGREVDEARQVEIAKALEQRIAALPSVDAAGFGSGIPPTGEVMRVSFVISNAANPSGEAHMVTSVPASPDYFTTLAIPLLHGRVFSGRDESDRTPVVVVNREAARRFFGREDAVGQTLPNPYSDGSMTVVGVVGNVKYTGVSSGPEPVVYVPFSQSPFRLVILVARTSGDAAAIAEAVRRIIREYDAGISIESIRPLTTWVTDDVAQPRFRMLLLSALAGVALLLAAIGLYGVIAYLVVQRTVEIGVRVALGARTADVVGLVVGEGARLAVSGIVLGLVGAYATTRVLSSLLYGVTPTDAVSIAGAAGSLLVIALLASAVPAWRASRIDPATALRAE